MSSVAREAMQSRRRGDGGFSRFLLCLIPLFGSCALEDTPLVGISPVDEERLPPPEQAPIFGPPRFKDHLADDFQPAEGDRYGASVAVGRFTQAHHNELAVSAPGHNGGEGIVIIYRKDGDSGEEESPIVAISPSNFQSDTMDGTFGTALAAGRFNDDNLDDLAIGMPGNSGYGRVLVVYGGDRGFEWLDARPRAVETLRRFGQSLAVGDFNDDDFGDLAVGEPGGNDPDHDFEEDGVVTVYWGTADGLDTETQQTVRAINDDQSLALFGWSLAVGNFSSAGNALKFPDLAVGAPGYTDSVPGGEPIGGVGRVYVFRPVLPDPDVDGFELDRVIPTPPNWVPYVRGFGQSLAGGNFNDDDIAGARLDDLAIGAPRSSVPPSGVDVTFPEGSPLAPEAGLVAIARHDSDQSGLSNVLRFVSQEGMGFSEMSDHFGWSVAAGDFNRDGPDDLAIGSPNEDFLGIFNPVPRAGAVFFRFGAGGENLDGGITALPVECYDYVDAVRDTAQSREGDRFGAVLLAADLDNDSGADLIVGAPDTDTDSAIDAGAVWIGINETTTPGPFEGDWSGMIADDCSDAGAPAEVRFELHDREGALCGFLSDNRQLCFMIEDAEVRVRAFSNRISTRREENTVQLQWAVTVEGERIGTLSINGEVPEGEDTLILNLRFRTNDGAVDQDLDPVTLGREN